MIKRFLDKFLKGALVSLFILMVISTVTQVIFRYFLRYPLGWTEELSRILFIWCTFLSVGILANQQKLMKVDALVNYLPEKVRALALTAINLISAVFLLWLGILGIRLLELAKGQITPALMIPYWLIYLSLPVGILLAVFFILYNETSRFLKKIRS
jgi:TRAP-type C4-dicarboxylate transport system permease small subunit